MMNKHWSILLALLLMLSMTVSAYASGGEPAAPDDQQLRPAYEAYLDLLQEKRGDIESYWHSQAVALADITGDGMPELFYLQPGQYTLTTLYIVTFRDGELTWLYSDESTYWDGQVGGGFAHCLFQVEGDTALYAYLRPTFEGEGHIGYSRFTEKEDGTLERVPVCEQIVRGESVSYQADGAETTEDGYWKKAEELGSSVTAAFQSTMSSWGDEGLPGQSDLQSMDQAMSCGEAIQYLQTLIEGGAQQEDTAAPAAGESDDLAEKWLGKWYASTGESLDIYDVSETGLSVSYRIMYEIGEKMASLYELKFDDETKTSATLTGDGFGEWTFTFVLGDGHITVQSEIPDQEFVKNDGTAVVPFWDTLRVTGDAVNIRTGPGTEYDAIGSAYRDESLTASGKIGNWYQLDYNGTTAYIIEDYVVESGWFSVNEDSGTLTVTKDQAELHTGPAVGYESVGSVSAGTTLTVTGRHGRWYQVDYSGSDAFILDDDVDGDDDIQATAAPATPSPTPEKAAQSAEKAAKPKTVSSCVFVKDGQVFYIDNVNRTPIYIEDFPTSTYDGDPSPEHDITMRAFSNWWYRCYASDQFMIYSSVDGTGSSVRDLWIKDLSSPDGEAIHIADDVEEYTICYASGEKAIYYVVYPGTIDVYHGDKEYVKYRYDIQTGESVLWEKGDGTPQEAAHAALYEERLKILYGVGSDSAEELPEDEELLAEYEGGDRHYYKKNSLSSASVYYWDGSTETYLCDLSSTLFPAINRSKHMVAVVCGRDRGVLLMRDKAIELQPLFAEGTTIYEVCFSSDGNTGYCSVLESIGEGGDRGVYKFAVYEDGIGPMELLDHDMGALETSSAMKVICYPRGDDVYYARMDASLCCNGHVVDPTCETERIFGFCGDELLYMADVQSSDGRYSSNYPFTLRAANTQDYKDINGCVIDYKLSGGSMWYVGDYDYWSSGTLYLYEDGVSTVMVDGVSVIG